MGQIVRGDDEPLEPFLQELLMLAGPDRAREVSYDASTRIVEVPDDVAEAFMAGHREPADDAPAKSAKAKSAPKSKSEE